MKYLLNIPID